MESTVMSAGLLGRYYAARHSHGHYRNCAVTGRYTISAKQDVLNLLNYALMQTIDRHPSLGYIVVDKTSSSEAAFIRLATIGWDDVVVTKIASSRDQDKELAKELGIQHQRLWKPSLPSWRIMVLSHKYSHEDTVRVNDIAFISHHAISDGLSAAAFHKSLLKYLHEASSKQLLHSKQWPYVVPQNINRALPLEDVIQYKPHLTSQNAMPLLAMKSNPVKAWTGAPPNLPTIDTFISRTQFLTIPGPEVASVLKECRRLKITLTGLIHSLIIIYLAKTIPHAQGFRAVTPYSMRKFTNTSSEEIANYFSYVASDWEVALVSSARLLAECSEEEDEFIGSVSKQYFNEMKNEIDQIHTRGPKILNAISAIEDLDKYCQECMTQEQGTTYEMSNLGAVTVPEPSDTSLVKLEKLVFTQCGTIGLAFGCGVVSLVGGPLTVSLYWQEDIVEEQLMDGLKTFLQRRLLGLSSSSRNSV